MVISSLVLGKYEGFFIFIIRFNGETKQRNI